MRLRALLAALAALALAALAGCATPVPPTGPLDASVSGPLAFKVSDRVTLSGTLAFPAGPGPVPAVVLMHGCNGIGARVRGWERELRGWGYATFVVDSFGGRGLREVCVGGGLTSEDRTGDAHAALAALAAHQRVEVTLRAMREVGRAPTGRRQRSGLGAIPSETRCFWGVTRSRREWSYSCG